MNKKETFEHRKLMPSDPEVENLSKKILFTCTKKVLGCDAYSMVSCIMNGG